jgi:hypothetical protein
MTHRPGPRREHLHGRAFAGLISVAVWLVGAACSGATPAAVGNAPSSTPGSTPALSTAMPINQMTIAPVVRAAPTAPAPAATSLAKRQPSATPITVAATLPPVPDVPVAAAAAPAPEGATPDRPFGPRSRASGCAVSDALPDIACTPGAIFPDVTAEQVCRRGYSTSVRNVPAAVSQEVYRAYGILKRTTGEFEVDHHVALEIGGSNDIANLWPEAAEPRPGFHEKDQVENYLHDQVCAGRMSLFEAQRAIATNWLEVFQRLHQPVLPPVAVATTIAVPQVPLEPASGGVQITSVSGAAPGGRATISARTAAGTSCSITYRTPAGSISTAQGLTPRTADNTGLVTWSWSIGPSTRPGTGSVTVACSGASVSTPIQIG